MARKEDRTTNVISHDREASVSSKLYSCRFEGCSSTFKKEAHLSRHELIHNDIRPFPCSHKGCTKSFRSNSHMKRHEKTHSGAKDFHCEYEGCNVACFTAWNLKRHIRRTHEGTFKCSKCDKEFKKNKLLHDHISLEHKRSTISCNFPGCAQIFKNAAKMKHHQKVHSGKGYNCPVKDCDRKFALWSECRLHAAQCKENVLRSCEVCGKTFSTRSNLKAHKKVHSEEQEVFVCHYEDCDRFYTKQSNLKVHIQTYHQKIRQFECTKADCNKSYNYKHLLRKHMDWHANNNIHHNGTAKEKSLKRKRPKRMVTSDLSAITGYVPELWTKMTPAEMNAYVLGPEINPECYEDTDLLPDTTQAEMSPMLSEEFSSSIMKSSDEISKQPHTGDLMNLDQVSVQNNVDEAAIQSSEDTLTARTSDMEIEDEELGIILERSTLEEAASYLDCLNRKSNLTSSSNSNSSSRASSVCNNSGVTGGLKLFNENLQHLFNQQKKDSQVASNVPIPESCRMQSVSRTDSDSSDNERSILCAS